MPEMHAADSKHDVKQELDIAYKRERDQFFEKLQEFHKARGTPFQRIPTFGGQALDLYALYNTVVSFGGICVVTEKKKWGQVFRALGFPPCTNAAYALKQHYSRYLEVYERIFFHGEDTEDPTSTRSYAQMLKYRRLNKASKHGPFGEPLVDNFNRISFSLQSGLQNEVDFALNICSLLSNVPNSIFNLAKCPAILDLMLGHVGIWSKSESHVKNLYDEWYTKSEKDFVKFWRRALDDPIAREIYEEDNLDPTLLIEKYRLDEKNTKLFVDKDDDIDIKSSECCRINQVCIILYNFSFEQMNSMYLASHDTALRFLLMASCCNHSNIQRAGLDALDNIANNITLEGMESTFTQRFVQIMDKFLHSEDKFRRCGAMSILAKLATKESNKPVLTQTLSEDIYKSLVETLYLPDIALILASLDTLYCFTSLDEIIATGIAKIHGSIDVLVCLITVRAETYGNKAIKGYRIIENKHSMFTPKNQQWLKEQEHKRLQQQQQHAFSANSRVSQRHSLLKMPHRQSGPGKYMYNPNMPVNTPPYPNYPMNRPPHMNQNYPVNPSQHGMNMNYPINNMSMNKHVEELVEIDAATYTANWMSGYYEPHPTNMLYINSIYDDYVACCKEIHRLGVLDLTEFIKVLRSIIPPNLAQILPPDSEGKIGISGITRRKQPMPVQSKIPRHISDQHRMMKPQNEHPSQYPHPRPPSKMLSPMQQDMPSSQRQPHMPLSQVPSSHSRFHSPLPQSPRPSQMPYSQMQPQIPYRHPSSQMPQSSMQPPHIPPQIPRSQVPPQMTSQIPPLMPPHLPPQISRPPMSPQMPPQLSQMSSQPSLQSPLMSSPMSSRHSSQMLPPNLSQMPPQYSSQMSPRMTSPKPPHLSSPVLPQSPSLRMPQLQNSHGFPSPTSMNLNLTLMDMSLRNPQPQLTMDNSSPNPNSTSTGNVLNSNKESKDGPKSPKGNDEESLELEKTDDNDIVVNKKDEDLPSSEVSKKNESESDTLCTESKSHSIVSSEAAKDDNPPVSSISTSVSSDTPNTIESLTKLTQSVNQATVDFEKGVDLLSDTPSTESDNKVSPVKNDEIETQKAGIQDTSVPSCVNDESTVEKPGISEVPDPVKNATNNVEAIEQQSSVALELSKSYLNGENWSSAPECQGLVEKLKMEMQGHFMQFHIHRQHIQAIQMQIQQLVQQTQADNLPRNIIKNIQMRVQNHHVQMQSHYQRLQQLNTLSEQVQSQFLKKNEIPNNVVTEPSSQPSLTAMLTDPITSICQAVSFLNASKPIESPPIPSPSTSNSNSTELKVTSLPNLDLNDSITTTIASSPIATNMSPSSDVAMSPNSLSLKQKGKQFIVPPPFPYMQNNLVSIQHGIPNGSYIQSPGMMSPPSSPLVPKATKGSSKGAKSRRPALSPGGKKLKTAKNLRLGRNVKKGNAGDEKSAFSRVKQGSMLNGLLPGPKDQLCSPFQTASGTTPGFPKANVPTMNLSAVGQPFNNNTSAVPQPFNNNSGVPPVLRNPFNQTPLSPGVMTNYSMNSTYNGRFPSTSNPHITKDNDNSIPSASTSKESHAADIINFSHTYNGDNESKSVANGLAVPRTLETLDLNSQTTTDTKSLFRNMNGSVSSDHVQEDSSIEVKKLRDLTEQLESNAKKKKTEPAQLDNIPMEESPSKCLDLNTLKQNKTVGTDILDSSVSEQKPHSLNFNPSVSIEKLQPTSFGALNLNPSLTIEKLQPDEASGNSSNKESTSSSLTYTNGTLGNVIGSTNSPVNSCQTINLSFNTSTTAANLHSSNTRSGEKGQIPCSIPDDDEVDFVKHDDNNHVYDEKKVNTSINGHLIKNNSNSSNTNTLLPHNNIQNVTHDLVASTKTITLINSSVLHSSLKNPASTSTFQLPSHIDKSIGFYSCKWESCKLPPFQNVTGLLSHMILIHAPVEGQLVACKVPGCSTIKKPRRVMISHFQEKHCLKRNKDGIMSSVPLPKINLPKEMEWKFEDESPVTRSVRHTAALILRNIARISSYGKKLILPYEDRLALVAISTSEAASSAAECLVELSKSTKEIPNGGVESSDFEANSEDTQNVQKDQEYVSAETSDTLKDTDLSVEKTDNEMDREKVENGHDITESMDVDECEYDISELINNKDRNTLSVDNDR